MPAERTLKKITSYRRVSSAPSGPQRTNPREYHTPHFFATLPPPHPWCNVLLREIQQMEERLYSKIERVEKLLKEIAGDMSESIWSGDGTKEAPFTIIEQDSSGSEEEYQSAQGASIIEID
jgi:hypothetical protein